VFKVLQRNAVRKEKHRRLRANIVGTGNRPRLNVFRSNSHIYAQIIDDTSGVTLAAASTLDKVLKDQLGEANKKDAAKMVGKLIAQRALEKGIAKVVFDRGGYIYHGRIAAVAEGAREGGLEF